MLLPEEETQVVAREIARAVVGKGPEAIDIVRRLVAAFEDDLNHQLRSDARSRKLSAATLVEMDEHDLVNPVERQRLDEKRDERAKAKNVQALKAAQAGPGTSFFKCPRCGARDALLTELQTCGGDEPTTKFLYCQKCEYNWRTR